ncbi:MAG: hypothetical protein ACKPKO_30155, partial [Candidatus Fonsibacter sp.]
TTMVVGWRQFVTGEPMIRNKNIVIFRGLRFPFLSTERETQVRKMLGRRLKVVLGVPQHP